MDIDVQGVKTIKRTTLNPWFVFVMPPSVEELEARLKARQTESDDTIALRLVIAKQELRYGNQAVSSKYYW